MQSAFIHRITLHRFSSDHSPEMPFNSISNVSLANALTIPDGNEIRSVHLSMGENVGEEDPIQPHDLCQYNYVEVFIWAVQVESFNFSSSDISK